MDSIEYNADVASDAFAVPEPVQKLIDKQAAKETEKEPAGADKEAEKEPAGADK